MSRAPNGPWIAGLLDALPILCLPSLRNPRARRPTTMITSKVWPQAKSLGKRLRRDPTLTWSQNRGTPRKGGVSFWFPLKSTPRMLTKNLRQSPVGWHKAMPRFLLDKNQTNSQISPKYHQKPISVVCNHVTSFFQRSMLFRLGSQNCVLFWAPRFPKQKHQAT